MKNTKKYQIIFCYVFYITIFLATLKITLPAVWLDGCFLQTIFEVSEFPSLDQNIFSFLVLWFEDDRNVNLRNSKMSCCSLREYWSWDRSMTSTVRSQNSWRHRNWLHLSYHQIHLKVDLIWMQLAAHLLSISVEIVYQPKRHQKQKRCSNEFASNVFDKKLCVTKWTYWYTTKAANFNFNIQIVNRNGYMVYWSTFETCPKCYCKTNRTTKNILLVTSKDFCKVLAVLTFAYPKGFREWKHPSRQLKRW